MTKHSVKVTEGALAYVKCDLLSADPQIPGRIQIKDTKIQTQLNV